MAELADELWDGRQGEEQASLLERLELEQGNLQAAIAHATTARDADLLLRLARDAQFLWVRRGMGGEADAVLERALQVGVVGDPALRVDALRERSYVQVRLKDDDGAAASAQQAVALARELGDDLLLGNALVYLGSALMRVDQDSARASYENAINILRPHGATREFTNALFNLANLVVLDRDFEAARAAFAEALELDPHASGGGPWFRGITHLNLAEVLYHLGRNDEAFHHAREGAAYMRQTGGPIGLANSIFVAAAILAARGDAHRAGVLLGVVDRAFAEAGEQIEAMEALLRETILEGASPDELDALHEGMQAEPAPTLEQAFAETFPDL
jgi:tetratricopeptide (TPR) repeat protein